MTAADPTYPLLEQRLAAWAEARPDVRAVLVIGSRARSDHPADSFSDLDIILFVDDSQAWVADPSWRAGLEVALGRPAWFAAFGYTGRDEPEWEYVLEGGYKVDLVVTSNRAGPRASLAEMIAASVYGFVFQRGCRVLVNKQPGEGLHLQASLPEQSLPAPADFEGRVVNALLELVRAARMAQRGEYWRAAYAVNYEFQQNLLALLEWQARSAEPPRTAWHYGRFLEEWADPRALVLLPATFANSSQAGVSEAIRGSLAMLDWLVPQTAAQLGFAYPQEALRKTKEFLSSLPVGARSAQPGP